MCIFVSSSCISKLTNFHLLTRREIHQQKRRGRKQTFATSSRRGISSPASTAPCQGKDCAKLLTQEVCGFLSTWPQIQSDPEQKLKFASQDVPSGQTFNCSGFAGRSLGSTIASTRAVLGDSSALLIAGTTSSGRAVAESARAFHPESFTDPNMTLSIHPPGGVHPRTSLWSSRSLFPRKSDFGGRDRTAVTSGEAQCEESRDQVDPVESANTGLFGAAPGNLRGAATDWSSNQGPGRFYRRRATGSLRDRSRSDTNTVFPGTAALDTGVACRISRRRAVRCEVSRCSREHGRRRRTPRRYIAGNRWAD
jgi:hypothetical protein